MSSLSTINKPLVYFFSSSSFRTHRCLFSFRNENVSSLYLCFEQCLFVCLLSPDRIDAHRLFFRSLAMRVFHRCARLSDIFICVYIRVCVHVFEVLANYDEILEDEKKKVHFIRRVFLTG